MQVSQTTKSKKKKGKAKSKPVTYNSYLKINELLDLQKPLSDGPEHDEMLFIIIHQVYELWFKQIMHEMSALRGTLATGDTFGVLHTLKRVLTIMKTCVVQIDVLETMTPLSFLSFRSRLESASGFQSAQFRELEFVLGSKNRARLEHFPEGTPAREALEQRYAEPTLYDAFARLLAGRGYAVPRELLERDVTESLKPSPQMQKVLVEVYRNDPTAAQICERLVDLDEGLQEWRYRHVKMVERTVGTKRGTGGSSGADYLKATLFHPVFPDLWEVRGVL